MPGDNIHRSVGARERTQQRELNAARHEFAGSIAGQEAAQQTAQILALGLELAQIRAELAALKTNSVMRGDGANIDVKGNVIYLRKRNDGSGNGSTLAILDEGIPVVATANTLNFVGAGVNALVNGANPLQVDVTVTGMANLTVKEETGAALTTVCTVLDFIGSGLTATLAAAGSIKVTYAFSIYEGGSARTTDCSTIVFTGNTVTSVVASGGATNPIATVTLNDATVPTNSGATGYSVLKTGTNVVARKIIGTAPIVVAQNADDLTISYSGSGYTLAVKQAGSTIVAAATALNFAESDALASILVITDAGGGQATLTFNRLEWIGCSSGSPVYVDDYSFITGSYP